MEIPITLQRVSRELQMEPAELEKLGYWFAQCLDWDEKREIFELARNEFFQRKNSFAKDESDLVMLTCFLSAVNQVRSQRQSAKKKKPQIDEQVIRAKIEKRLEAKELLKQEKKRYIISKFHEIDRMFHEGKSWRYISAYIFERYKKQISHIYLRKIYLELTANQKERGQS